MPSATSGSSAGGDLVADDQVRLRGECPGDADPLLLAAPELGRVALGELRLELDQVQKLGHAVAPLAPALAEVELERPADDFADTSAAG